MTPPKVVLSREAELDLEDIWSYVAADNAERADHLIDTLFEKILFLGERPSAGRERKELSPGLRSFPAGNYIIFYRISRPGIDVVRILSGYRDVDQLF
jgi:toxin ParE1/3/4